MAEIFPQMDLHAAHCSFPESTKVWSSGRDVLPLNIVLGGEVGDGLLGGY